MEFPPFYRPRLPSHPCLTTASASSRDYMMANLLSEVSAVTAAAAAKLHLPRHLTNESIMHHRHHASSVNLTDVKCMLPYEMTPTMTEEEIREQAWRICQDYLSGAWKTVSSEEMGWKPISGGLSNYLYFCALPSGVRRASSSTSLNAAASARPSNDRNNSRSSSTSSPTKMINRHHGKEPRDVLVRIYGQVYGDSDGSKSLVAESVIFTVLSERGLGPKLYGVFPGGRLEEYIPSPSLETKELFDPDISAMIAEQLARMHTLQLPLSKEPTWMWETMRKWSRAIRKNILPLDKCPKSPAFPDMDPEVNEKFFRFIKAIDLEAEISWLKDTVEAMDSPVVFGHNDLQEGNILCQKADDGSIVRLAFIDFEYCSYNYRGFDLANHFCEWMYDYKVEEAPFFTNSPENYPSRDAQLHFLKHYLDALAKEQLSSSGSCGPGHNSSTADPFSFPTSVAGVDGSERVVNGVDITMTPDLQHLLDEVDVFQLASHLFWSMWSCVNATKSNIPFGYWDYSVCRAQAYLSHKKKVQQKIKKGELPSLIISNGNYEDIPSSDDQHHKETTTTASKEVQTNHPPS